MSSRRPTRPESPISLNVQPPPPPPAFQVTETLPLPFHYPQVLSIGAWSVLLPASPALCSPRPLPLFSQTSSSSFAFAESLLTGSVLLPQWSPLSPEQPETRPCCSLAFPLRLGPKPDSPPPAGLLPRLPLQPHPEHRFPDDAYLLRGLWLALTLPPPAQSYQGCS